MLIEYSLNLNENNIEFFNRTDFESDDTIGTIEKIAEKEHVDWMTDIDEAEFNE